PSTRGIADRAVGLDGDAIAAPERSIVDGDDSHIKQRLALTLPGKGFPDTSRRFQNIDHAIKGRPGRLRDCHDQYVDRCGVGLHGREESPLEPQKVARMPRFSKKYI